MFGQISENQNGLDITFENDRNAGNDGVKY